MNYKKILKNDIFVFLLLFLIFYAIFRYSDSFNKGYNIVEDHLIMNTNQSLEVKSSISVFSDMMKLDLEGYKRFRPFWVFYAFITIKIFGINLLYINIFVVLLGVITSFLLFKFCLNIGFNYFESILFSLITIIGPATVMWIRMIDAEIIGMLTLSISLFYLSKSIYSQKNRTTYQFLFLFFLFICALCKESFLILIPAILFLFFFLYGIKNNTGFIDTMKKNKLLITIIIVFTLICVFLILKYMGLTAQRYSGVDSKIVDIKAIEDFFYIIFNIKMFLITLFGIIIYIVFKLKNDGNSIINFKNSVSIFLIPFIFLFLVILPQFILYYKTGFEGRYFLPFLMGFSFLLIYVLKVINVSKFIPILIKYFYLSIIVVYLTFTIVNDTVPELSKFSKLCRSTTEVLKILTNTKDNFLIVMDPVQNFNDLYSLNVYLSAMKIQKNFNYDLIKRDALSGYYKDSVFYGKRLELAQKYFNNNKFQILDSTISKGDVNHILIFYGLDKKFLEKTKIGLMRIHT